MDQHESILKLIETKSGKSIRNGWGELVKTIDQKEKQATIPGTTIIKPQFRRIEFNKD